jgi:hypothetical protein
VSDPVVPVIPANPVIPAIPELPEDARATGTVPTRYEDVAQDGRVVLIALPHALGAVAWPRMSASSIAPIQRAGVIPILARMVLEGTDETVSAVRSLTAETLWTLASSPPEAKAKRVYLNMWATIQGRRGRTYGGKRDGDGADVVVGRLFAEHVFTRPFAPKEARRVESLPLEGGDYVPPLVHQSRTVEDVLGERASLSLVDRVAFGIMHTDSNQHVNSLVYPQLAEEAILRAMALRGMPHAATALARHCEIVWKKPCFAGETVGICLTLTEHPHGADAVVAFVDDGTMKVEVGGGMASIRAALRLQLRVVTAGR